MERYAAFHHMQHGLHSARLEKSAHKLEIIPLIALLTSASQFRRRDAATVATHGGSARRKRTRYFHWTVQKVCWKDIRTAVSVFKAQLLGSINLSWKNFDRRQKPHWAS